MKSKTAGNVTQLIEDNQGLVHSIAMKIHRSLPVRYDLDDLLGYGMVGLGEAAKAFKPMRGVEFSTFAYYRIRGAIYDGISEVAWMSRARYRRLVSKQSQTANEESGDSATESSSATDSVVPVMQSLTQVQQDSIEDDVEVPESSVIRRESHEELCALVDQLPQAQNRLITMVYFDGMSIQAAADRLGISKSWASRLHAKTLTELARELR